MIWVKVHLCKASHTTQTLCWAAQLHFCLVVAVLEEEEEQEEEEEED